MISARRVLVVDGDLVMRELLRRILVKLNYEVMTAANGPQALALFAAYEMDVVLLDIVMPQMDGLMLCKQLRHGSDVPLIVVTALNQPIDLTRAWGSGADAYLVKPFTTQTLQQMLQLVLGYFCTTPRKSVRHRGPVDTLGQRLMVSSAEASTFWVKFLSIQ